MSNRPPDPTERTVEYSRAEDESVQLGSRYEEKSAKMVQAGRIIAGKYQIEGMLGRGGMGVVARGRQLELDRSVAVKFLLRTPDGSRQNQRFTREARAIAKMRSEHVVRVFDVGVEDGVPFIVMEHLQGNDLASALESGPLNVELTVSYLLQACEAIAEAHSLGIVHRDLKPSNLFVAESVGGRRVLKVLDFGVSKWLRGSAILDNDVVTSQSSFIGTPGYVSPEQLTHPETVDERTDIWALGVVLYQCLSGRLPFRADSVPEMCAQILRSEPEPMDSAIAVPPELRQVIARCLRKNIDARYSSAVELARALAPFAPPSARGVLEAIELLKDGARPPSNPEMVDFASSTRPATALGFTQDASTDQTGAQGAASATARRRRWLTLAAALAVAVPVFALLSSRQSPQNPPENSTERPSSSASATLSGESSGSQRENDGAPGPARTPPPPASPPSPSSAPGAAGGTSAIPRGPATPQREPRRHVPRANSVAATPHAAASVDAKSAASATAPAGANGAAPAESVENFDTSHLYRH